MTANNERAALPGNAMTEAELQREVRAMAKELRLETVHVPRRAMLGNPPGWPDLIILGPHGILFRELKSDLGRVSRAQSAMGARLLRVGGSWDVWRPDSLASGRIRKELTEIALAEGRYLRQH
jgi:hypothetical protein